MGFHDAEWAYSIDRPLAETAVLAALCHRTDDATHETFVGQQKIAQMIGSSAEKVHRALKALEVAGVISRSRRNGPGGYRTSDLIRVNVDTYLPNLPPGETPSRQNAYQEVRRDLPADSSEPTRQKVTAIDQPDDHPEVQPDLMPDAFDEVWAAWPKKTERKRSRELFLRKAKVRGLNTLKADIVRFGRAYAATTVIQFTPSLAAWLNRDRWNDPLPAQPPPTDDQWNAFMSEESGKRASAAMDALGSGPATIGERGHRNEPNARDALTTLRRERALPMDLDGLMIHAYRLGEGDPWAGYMRIKHATTAAFTTATNPAAALRARLETA